MASAEEYAERVNQMFSGGVNFEWNNLVEAQQNLLAVKLVRQKLLAIKREINLEISQIRDSAKMEKQQIGNGFLSGLAGGLFGRGNVNQINAARKRGVAIQLEQHLTPYKTIKTQLESCVIQLDHLKNELEVYIAMNR